MLRIQVNLDEQDYKLAKKEAAALSISVAEYVRRAVKNTLPPTGRPKWMRYAGLIESGNSRSSQSVDEIVYGHKD
jgi:phage gpG-like protein